MTKSCDIIPYVGHEFFKRKVCMTTISVYVNCIQKVREFYFHGLTDACPDINIAFTDIPHEADILVSDSLRTFDGLLPVNGQLFAVMNCTSEKALPSHFRLLGITNPLRELARISRHMHEEKTLQPKPVAAPLLAPFDFH